MKLFSVHSITAAAALTLNLAAAQQYIQYFPMKVNEDWGCGRNATDPFALSHPCGSIKSKAEACPVVVKRTTNNNTPVVACDEYVEIGTINDVHNITRKVWGIVSGHAADTSFETDVTFGVSAGTFQALCPFACLSAGAFKQCVDHPAKCATGETFKEPTVTTSGYPVGGFAQLGKQELAHRFESDAGKAAIVPYKPDKLAAAPAPQYVYSGGFFKADTAVNNCPKFQGNKTTVGEMSWDCGYGGRLPCVLESSVPADCSETKCKKITFYRPGLGGMAFCAGGVCPPLGLVQRQFKIVRTDDSPLAEYNSVRPRGLLPPGAVSSICKYACGTGNWGDVPNVDFAPACVNSKDKCASSSVVNDIEVNWGGAKFTFPGSFFNYYWAVEEIEETCGTGINSAVGNAAPGLLTLAAAAVVAIYSS